MMGTLAGAGIGMILLFAIIWWLPIILILTSSKTSGVEKLIWLALMFFFSWFSWILYMILAPVGEKAD